MCTSGHFSVLDFAWKKEVFLAAEHRDVWQCHQCSNGGRMGGWASKETVADSFGSLWRDKIWWVRALAVQTFCLALLLCIEHSWEICLWNVISCLCCVFAPDAPRNQTFLFAVSQCQRRRTGERPWHSFMTCRSPAALKTTWGDEDWINDIDRPHVLCFTNLYSRP